MFTKKFFGAFLTFFRKRHRFRLAYGIGDHPLFVETLHRTPVVSFPGSATVMEREEEKRQHHFVDFVFVIFHSAILPSMRLAFNRTKAPNSPPASDSCSRSRAVRDGGR
jgi:hypothetical protein